MIAIPETCMFTPAVPFPLQHYTAEGRARPMFLDQFVVKGPRHFLSSNCDISKGLLKGHPMK